MRSSRMVFFRDPSGQIWSRLDFHVARPTQQGNRSVLRYMAVHNVPAKLWVSLELTTELSNRERNRHLKFWARHAAMRRTTYRMFPNSQDRR